MTRPPVDLGLGEHPDPQGRRDDPSARWRTVSGGLDTCARRIEGSEVGFLLHRGPSCIGTLRVRSEATGPVQEAPSTAPRPVCVLGLPLGPLPASLIIAVSMARASARAGRPHAHRHQMFSARSSRPSRWSRERVLCAGSAGTRLHIVVEMSAAEHRLQSRDDSRAPVAHMASQWQARLPESLNGVEGSAL
jgi:hypothetical protein